MLRLKPSDGANLSSKRLCRKRAFSPAVSIPRLSIRTLLRCRSWSARYGEGRRLLNARRPMPDTHPQTTALDEANRHHQRADEFRLIAETSHRPGYWLSRASIAYALAQTIILSMKEDCHG